MPQVHGCRGAAHFSQNFPKNKLAEVETELADTFVYLVLLADKFGIDLLKAAENKLELNDQKCFIDKAKGNTKRYMELD